MKTNGLNDLDLDQWRDYPEIWTHSLWDIPKRDKTGGHKLEYHGNFVPQIVDQVVRRYTRRRDWVVDPFLGMGTTMLECMRLDRHCSGIELQERVRIQVAERVIDQLTAVGDTAPVTQIVAGDATQREPWDLIRARMAIRLHSMAQLVILHPPYDDIIRFSNDPACLSNTGSTEAFLEKFRQVVEHSWELLQPGRMAVLVMGDKYRDGELVPLGWLCTQVLQDRGFKLKSIVVKNVTGNEVKGKNANLWRRRALQGNFCTFDHEYVITLQKPLKVPRSKQPTSSTPGGSNE